MQKHDWKGKFVFPNVGEQVEKILRVDFEDMYKNVVSRDVANDDIEGVCVFEAKDKWVFKTSERYRSGDK